MGEPTMDLPEDLLGLIFRGAGDDCMGAISLVCRRFLSITNRNRFDLTISDWAVYSPCGGGGIYSRLFRRFPNLRRIAFGDFRGDLGHLLREIARSDLEIETLDLSGQRQSFPRSAVMELGATKGRCLRTLILARFLLLENDDVLAIAASFPNLEELDISHPQQELYHTSHLRQMVTDDAIAVLSSKLPKLRSINLSGNHFLSDNALVSLASNCPLLAEIVAHDCSFMKGRGVVFALRRCRNLTSLLVNKVSDLSLGGETELFLHATALRRLSLSRMAVSDRLLISLGKVGLPLLELSLSECSGLSFAGLSAVLQACGRTLCRLVLGDMGFLSDDMMIALLPYLSTLNSINISYCSKVSNITFFSIVKCCACIEKIEMRRTALGLGDLPADLCKNGRIRCLNLANNTFLDDNTIRHIAEVSPQLQSLDVDCCWEVTGEGMGKIGEMCREITHLGIKGCNQIKNLGSSLDFLKLETLMAPGSGFEDEALLSIALCCKKLLQLDLRGCTGVTEKGVKEIVRECNKLQNLYMGVHNVDVNVLSWIVFTRPLLRKIVWQSGLLPMKMRDLFLRHGCMGFMGDRGTQHSRNALWQPSRGRSMVDELSFLDAFGSNQTGDSSASTNVITHI